MESGRQHKKKKNWKVLRKTFCWSENNFFAIESTIFHKSLPTSFLFSLYFLQTTTTTKVFKLNRVLTCKVYRFPDDLWEDRKTFHSCCLFDFASRKNQWRQLKEIFYWCRNVIKSCQIWNWKNKRKSYLIRKIWDIINFISRKSEHGKKQDYPWLKQYHEKWWMLLMKWIITKLNLESNSHFRAHDVMITEIESEHSVEHCAVYIEWWGWNSLSSHRFPLNFRIFSLSFCRIFFSYDEISWKVKIEGNNNKLTRWFVCYVELGTECVKLRGYFTLAQQWKNFIPKFFFRDLTHKWNYPSLLTIKFQRGLKGFLFSHWQNKKQKSFNFV